MKSLSAFIASALFAIPSTLFLGGLASANTYVNGYTRSNGTRVQGHYRTSPNHTATDNWSYRGNTNPYTGKKGYSY